MLAVFRSADGLCVRTRIPSVSLCLVYLLLAISDRDLLRILLSIPQLMSLQTTKTEKIQRERHDAYLKLQYLGKRS